MRDWRGVLKSFPFAIPTRISFGEGAATAAAEETRALGRRPVVITDPGVQAAGLVDPITGSLKRAGLTPLVFAEVEANPRAEPVDRGAAAAEEHGADVIVAVGGGSALDSAKAISAVLAHGGSCLDYEYDAVVGDRVPGPSTPIVAIPTTSGTGSEVTLWAIVTDISRNYKAPIGSPHLAPRVALVDPSLTVSLPPAVTAGTGMDALTHAIEGYTARCSNPISDALCLYAAELVSSFLVRAFEDGADLEARSGMMLASLLAGMGFGNSDTAAVHSMGEALGGLKDIPHGVAMAICLPHVLRLNAQAVPERLARLGVAMGLPDSSDHEPVIDHVEGLVRRLQIPTLADCGVTEEDVPALVQIALRNSGNPDNPVDVDEEVFTRLYREALADRRATTR